MDYSAELRKNSIEMELFRKRYQDREKYLAYCRECPKYNTVWSCPPLQIDADAYLNKYAWVNVVGAKIILDQKVIKKAGVAGVIRPSKNTVQVIVGPKVQFVYDELKKML